MERQRNRHPDKETEGQTDKRSVKQIDRWTERQKDRLIDAQGACQTHKETDREMYKLMNRQIRPGLSYVDDLIDEVENFDQLLSISCFQLKGSDFVSIFNFEKTFSICFRRNQRNKFLCLPVP